MKKLFIIATLGVAGLFSAKQPDVISVSPKEITESQISQNTDTSSIMCEVWVKRTNADGSVTVVSYNIYWVENEAACNLKNIRVLQQTIKEMGIG
ncbi:MAG: hypothetical protein KA796_07400 [Chryseobacterium sp.]|nr:hypothetical protein [Chryseobacterium sp.]MBP7499674.1 hypothetical protein [Chryseobacterium sp.]